MFWRKQKEICKKGAVCAWEYNGSLYKTKELRDQAEERDQVYKAKSRLRKMLVDMVVLKGHPPHKLNGYYYEVGLTEERIFDRDKKYSSADLIDLLVDYYPQIHKTVKLAHELSRRGK